MELDIYPVGPDRWKDLEELFGPSGACSGCWCMYTRQTNRQFDESHGNRNRKLLRNIVNGGGELGLLAYAQGSPVGWVSMAPRSEFGRINRSRVTKPVDDAPVWSIPCFVIHRDFRDQGVASALLAAATARAAEMGAKAVEGYPVDPDGEIRDADAWHGLASMFRNAGFTEIARRTPGRPIFRKQLG